MRDAARSILPAFALLCLAAGLGAEELTFTFEGFVEADPAGVAQLTTRAEGAVVTWLAADGAAVAPGEAVALLDTARIALTLEARRRDLAVSEAQAALDRLRLEQELAELEDQRRALRADLAAARARLATVGDDDLLRRAEAEADAGRSAAAAERAGADAARSATAAADGDLAREEARLAADRAGDARWRARQAALAAARAAAADRTVERERLQVRVRELEARLGLAADGSEDGRHGLGGRIAAVAARRKGQERNARAELDARRRELQESERDVRDHLPLAWIELGGPGGLERRIDLVAAGAEPAPGWEADRGAPFDRRRGFGWDADAAGLMRAGGEGAPGRAGVCLVEGRRSWRIAVPDGPWTVRLGLGDVDDWDGGLVRIEGAEPWVANRIAGGSWPVCERRVAAAGGMIRVVFGDERPKALRAQTAGVVLRAPGIAPGDRVQRRTSPVAAVADPARLRISARIPPDLAGLLREPPPAAAGNPSSALRAALAPARLALRSADGGGGPATAARISDAPVGRRRSPTGWSDDDNGDQRDLLWREVWLQPAPGLAARPGAAVEVTATVALPADARVLPPHLVSLRDQAASVAPAGGSPLAVAALRAGDRVVAAGVPRGALAAVPPPAPPGDDGPFAGEVVAGACTRVVLPRSWGRVERLVADGRRVAPGDELMLLGSPWLERNRDRLAREKARAREDHRIALENRRLRGIQSAQDRDVRDGALAAARLDLDAALAGDPWPGRLAEAAAGAASAAAAAADARLARLRTLAQPDPQELAAAELQARRAAVALAAAEGAVPAARHGADALALVRLGEGLRAAAAALRLDEDADAIARAEADSAARSAHLRLENALQGNRREREFKEVRRVLSPAAGRVYLLNGWDEERRAWGRIAVGTSVWTGLPLAEIIDPAGLAFRAEVPERRYARLEEGAAAAVVFPQLGGLRVPGRVTRKARILDLPRDAREEALAPVAPVFAVTIALDIPADRRDDLAPGVKGMLELP